MRNRIIRREKEKWEIEEKKRKEKKKRRKEKERRKVENKKNGIEENGRKIEKEGERQIVYAQKLENKLKNKALTLSKLRFSFWLNNFVSSDLDPRSSSVISKTCKIEIKIKIKVKINVKVNVKINVEIK